MKSYLANKITFGSITSKLKTEDLRKLDIKNLRVLGSETISGGTFEVRAVEDLTKIKELGIQTIVDFRADASSVMQKRCANIGLGYLKFPLDDVLTLRNSKYFYFDKNNKMRVSDKFVQDLKGYFDTMNSENVYAGCLYGIDRTNIGLTLNFLLNPKVRHSAPEILTWPGEKRKSVLNKNTKIVKKILKALTPEQREYLGLSMKDNDYTNHQILKLLHKNHNNLDAVV